MGPQILQVSFSAVRSAAPLAFFLLILSCWPFFSVKYKVGTFFQHANTGHTPLFRSRQDSTTLAHFIGRDLLQSRLLLEGLPHKSTFGLQLWARKAPLLTSILLLRPVLVRDALSLPVRFDTPDGAFVRHSFALLLPIHWPHPRRLLDGGALS